MFGDKITTLLCLITITILSGILYLNSLHNSFHFDDFHHIVDNPYLKSIKYIPDFFTSTRTFSVLEWSKGHYRPLLLLTFTLNFYLNGIDPVGYRLVNLGFHIGSAFLVFLIVRAGRGGEGGWAPATMTALISALIFSVNPFNSEVVNYISARSSVMASFFYLLAFYCWVKYRSQKRSYFYIASLFAFLLGILTKEILITLPLMLWLYDLYFIPAKGPDWRGKCISHVKRLSAYIPFILFVAIPYIVIRAILIGRGPVYPPPRSYYENFLLVPKVFVKYIQLWFLPVNLSVEHAVGSIYSPGDWDFLAFVLFLSGLLSLCIWFYIKGGKKWKLLSFSITWYIIVQLPTTVIPLHAILQENRGYLAGVGLAVISGIFINALSSIPILQKASFLRNYMIPGSLLLLILTVYSVGTVQRNMLWRNETTLWADAVKKSPLSSRAHHNLAVAYVENGRIGSAIVEYQKALELAEGMDKAEIHNNRGSLYANLKLWDLAAYEFKTVIEINPYLHKAYNHLGTVYLATGNLDAAEEAFKKALSLYPRFLLARINLGRVYERMERPCLAIKEFEAILKMNRPLRDEIEILSDASVRLKRLKKYTGSC